MRSLFAFFRDESGPTAVEYAVLLSLIILSAFASIALFGKATAAMWADIRDDLG